MALDTKAWIKRRTRPSLWTSLKQNARRNLGLRAIALLVAIGLWVFVNAGQRGALVTLDVPVSYRALPVGMAIVNQRPDFVQIEIRGPRTLLSLLDPDRLTLHLDLSGVTAGQAVFKVGPEMFNVPRQTDVTRISPSQIVLDIDRVGERQIPINLNIHGHPAAGYRIQTVTVTPPKVTVRGPDRYISRVDRINTAPVEVNGAKGNVKQTVKLTQPGNHLRIEGPNEVEAVVTITQIISDRRFHKLTVAVRSTDHRVRVDPKAVDITVRGPLNALSKLDLHGSVFVTAEGLSPGLHDLPVQVTLPDGLQLVGVSPDNVKVRIYREKRSGSG